MTWVIPAATIVQTQSRAAENQNIGLHLCGYVSQEFPQVSHSRLPLDDRTFSLCASQLFEICGCQQGENLSLALN